MEIYSESIAEREKRGLYCTGDSRPLATRRNVECSGESITTVKLRGFRLELKG